MSANLERRPYGWERRATIGGTKSHPLIRGTAIVFNERSHDLGGFVEVIRPEAMRRTLSEGIDLRAFFDHDPGKVLGRLSAGTLKVSESRYGLDIEIDPPIPTEPANLMQSIERGDITGMSFGFRIMPEGEEWRREGGGIVRYVTDMRVHEVSVVSMPAYEPTHVEVALRSLHAFREKAAPTLAQLEAKLVRQRTWR
jgi:hypothetical protein